MTDSYLGGYVADTSADHAMWMFLLAPGMLDSEE